MAKGDSKISMIDLGDSIPLSGVSSRVATIFMGKISGTPAFFCRYHMSGGAEIATMLATFSGVVARPDCTAEMRALIDQLRELGERELGEMLSTEDEDPTPSPAGAGGS